MGRFWASVAMSEWEAAATHLDTTVRFVAAPNAWCAAHAARCAAHQATLRAGCGAADALGGGVSSPTPDADLGLAQRMAIPRWQAHKNNPPMNLSSYSPPAYELATECVTEANQAAYKWWRTPGTQPGARMLYEFVSRHFGFALLRPSQDWDAYACRANSQDRRKLSVHSEGRAVNFWIPTRPCNGTLWAGGRWHGHPTCSGEPRDGRGSARNDLGDPLALWLAQHAVDIGVAYLVYDRTAWTPRQGFHAFEGGQPYNDHLHVELERDAAASMDATRYPFYGSPAQRDVKYAPAQWPPNQLASMVGLPDGATMTALATSAAAAATGEGRRRLQSGGGGHGGDTTGLATMIALSAEQVDHDMDPADGSLLAFEASNARFVTAGTALRLDRSKWGEEAATLLFDAAIGLSGFVTCEDGEKHDVRMPFRTSVAMDFFPRRRRLGSGLDPLLGDDRVLPWLAGATASALVFDRSGTLAVDYRAMGTPFFAVKRSARCNINRADVALGSALTAQQCADKCAQVPSPWGTSEAGCEYFLWEQTKGGGRCMATWRGGLGVLCSEGWQESSMSTFRIVLNTDNWKPLSDSDLRWWSMHEQIRFRMELSNSAMRDSSGLCAAREQQARQVQAMRERVEDPVEWRTDSACAAEYELILDGCNDFGISFSESKKHAYMCCMANRWLEYSRCKFGWEREPIGSDCDYYCAQCKSFGAGGTYTRKAGFLPNSGRRLGEADEAGAEEADSSQRQLDEQPLSAEDAAAAEWLRNERQVHLAGLGQQQTTLAEAHFMRRHIDALGGSLLRPTRGAVDASMRSGLAALELDRVTSDAPVPLHLPAQLCEARCPAGTKLAPRSHSNSSPPPMSILLARALDGDDSPAGGGVSLASLSAHTLPAAIVACLDDLNEDYHSCGVEKRQAESRFLFCAHHAARGLNFTRLAWLSPDALPVVPHGIVDWWLEALDDVALPATAIAQLGTAFDCARYTDVQAAVCVCTSSATAGGGGGGGSSSSVDDDDGVGFLGGTVGMDADPRADNVNSDLLTVRSRLGSLGFAGEFERALRVATCAAEGVHTFEDPCDPGLAPCRVRGWKCPSARRTPGDLTCLRDVPCARQPIGFGDDSYLRGRDAHKWKELPTRGVGFVAAGTTMAR